MDCLLGDDGFATVCNLVKLDKVIMFNNQITQEGSIHLSRLNNLRELSYSTARLMQRTMGCQSKLPNQWQR